MGSAGCTTRGWIWVSEEFSLKETQSGPMSADTRLAAQIHLNAGTEMAGVTLAPFGKVRVEEMVTARDRSHQERGGDMPLPRLGGTLTFALPRVQGMVVTQNDVLVGSHSSGNVLGQGPP